MGDRKPTDLVPGVTVHVNADVDRVALGRLIQSMCNLNGITAAIELHAVDPVRHP
jgi:hypothetical protein